MKFKACILIAVCFASLSIRPVSAQTNDINQKKYYFFKVWGFLKYNHPATASGKIDADSIFLSNLPAIEEAKNNAEFNVIISNMLQQLGEVKVRTNNTKASSNKILSKNVNQAWFIKAQFLSKAVTG
jgi:hypothetical protein